MVFFTLLEENPASDLAQLYFCSTVPCRLLKEIYVENSLKLTNLFELKKGKVPVISPFQIHSAVLLSFCLICKHSEIKEY